MADYKPTETPKMVAPEGATSNTIERIEQIDRAAHANPELFQAALEELGASAVSGSVSTTEEAGEVRALDTDPKRLILEYFRNRFDRGGFDETSEDSIASDSDLKEQINVMTNMGSTRVMTGVMRSEIRHNPDAVPARDKIRLGRFKLYLGRVASFENQLKEQANLPTAG